MRNEAIPYRVAVLAAKALRLAGKPLTLEALGGVLKSMGLELDEDYLEDLIRLFECAGTGTTREIEPREVSRDERGAYVYAVAATGEEVGLGVVGIDGRRVFTLALSDIAAVVHLMEPEPYSSNDEDMVYSWVRAQQAVLDEATARWGTVIPMAFDTVFEAPEGGSIEVTVRDYLREHYREYRDRLEDLKGKSEYGVQVIYTSVGSVPEELEGSPGLRYMRARQNEIRLRERDLESAKAHGRAALELLRRVTHEVRVEPPKAMEGKHMVLNASVLLTMEQAERLGMELDALVESGLEVRFTGPWPPYSFV